MTDDSDFAGTLLRIVHFALVAIRQAARERRPFSEIEEYADALESWPWIALKGPTPEDLDALQQTLSQFASRAPVFGHAAAELAKYREKEGRDVVKE